MHQLEFMNRNFIFNLLVRNNRYGISLWVFNAISYKWAQESVMHQLEFKNRNFIFTCKKHNLLCCLLNILVTLFSTIFQRFPNTWKISKDSHWRRLPRANPISFHSFPKKLQRLSKFRRWLKIAKDFQPRSDDVLIIHQHV